MSDLVMNHLRQQDRLAHHAGSGMMGTMPGTGICRAA
jgi:hypothetical protein